MMQNVPLYQYLRDKENIRNTKIETQTKQKRTAFGDITNSFFASNRHGKRQKIEKTIFTYQEPSTPIFSDEGSFEVENLDDSPMQITPVKNENLYSPQIDTRDSKDPQYGGPYIKNIMELLRSIETKYLPICNYMENVQTDISPRMRAILIDWLVDVHKRFRLSPEAFYLCVNYIDRFLSKMRVSRSKLQLVGITAMLLASKYEEVYIPRVRDFVKISANAYTQDQVLEMEKLMLTTLGFNLTIATPYTFCTRYLKYAQADTKVEYLANYFMELAMMNYDSLKFTPSLLASSCIYLANKFVREQLHAWSMEMVHYTKYREEDLISCARWVHGLVALEPNEKLFAIYRKYSSPKKDQVARLAQKFHPFINI